MGLFSRKEVCPVCGRKIKGDVVIKIKDNVALCRDCSAMVNMDSALIPLQTVDDMKIHLAYRARNLERYENFESTWEAKAGTALLCVDESQKLWFCTKNRKDKNPPIFGYNEIHDVQYLEDGQPVAPEEKKSGLGALFGGKKEPVMLHSMKVHIELDNPYTKSIDVEALALNDEVKTGSLAYKSNRRALDKYMEILTGMMAHAKNAGNFDQKGSSGENGYITGVDSSASVSVNDREDEGFSDNVKGNEFTGEESEQEILEKYDNI